MKKIFLVLSALLFPFAAFAVTTDSDLTLTLPSDSTNYTLKQYSKFDTLIVNNSSFDFTISAGGLVTLESADRKKLSNTQNVNTECQSAKSIVTVGPGVGQTTATVAITPSGTCATGGGGGGSSSSGGGGGGGGGGYSPLPPASVPVPAPAPAPVSSAPAPVAPPVITFTKNLAAGDNNQDVLRLQTLLASDSTIYPEGAVTGYFGPATVRAVKRFQGSHGLPQVGRVGPATRAKLEEVFGEKSVVPQPIPPVSPSSMGGQLTKNLSIGSKNDDVMLLQQFLAKDPALYPEGMVSGRFGALTRKAVERFQGKYGIAKSGDSGFGAVGPKTRAKLNELMGQAGSDGSFPPPLSSNADDAAKLEALQQQLKALQDQLKAAGQ